MTLALVSNEVLYNNFTEVYEAVTEEAALGQKVTGILWGQSPGKIVGIELENGIRLLFQTDINEDVYHHLATPEFDGVYYRKKATL